MRLVLARALAVSFALFFAVSILADLRATIADPALWLVDLRALPATASLALRAGCTLAFLVFAFAPSSRLGRVGALLGATVVAAIGLSDVITYYRLLACGAFTTWLPLPFSGFVVFGAAAIAIACRSVPPREPPRRSAWVGTLAATVLSSFVPLQLVLFGATDYQRPTDAILVRGARVYADGTPSDALRDRIEAAAVIYLRGMSSYIIASGGPGDGKTTEAAAMREAFVSRGIPARAIIVDDEGVSTAASMRNTARIAEGRGLRSVLVVSHGYHLARAKLEGQCALGPAQIQVFTSPAPQRRRLGKLPYFFAREVAACWVYYFRRL